MKTKSAVFREVGKIPEIEELEIPKLEFGQVLVKIVSSGLCGAQIQELYGLKGNSKFMPHLTGHEGFGIVLETGIGVNKVKMGSSVILHWRQSSGIESSFPKYKDSSGNSVGGGKVNTISEYVVVSENRITPVSGDFSVEYCVLLGCAFSTGFGTVFKESNVRPGENVLVLGVGGVGSACLMASTLVSANRIVGIDKNPNKLEFVKKMGATEYFLSSDPIGGKFDVIIDTVGSPELNEKAISCLSDGGRYIFVTQSKGEIPLILDSNSFTNNGKTFKITQGGSFNPDIDIPKWLSLQWSLKPLCDILVKKYPLEKTKDAFESLISGCDGRILICP